MTQTFKNGSAAEQDIGTSCCCFAFFLARLMPHHHQTPDTVSSTKHSHNV